MLNGHKVLVFQTQNERDLSSAVSRSDPFKEFPGPPNPFENKDFSLKYVGASCRQKGIKPLCSVACTLACTPLQT